MVPPRARGKTTTSRIEERQRYHHATMATTTRTRSLPMSASREAVKSATRRETFLFSSSFFVLLWRIFAVKKHVLLLNSRARKKLKKSKYHLASTHVYIYIILLLLLLVRFIIIPPFLSMSASPPLFPHTPSIITRFKAKLLPVMRLRVASSSTPRKISREVKVLTKSRARSLYSFFSRSFAKRMSILAVRWRSSSIARQNKRLKRLIRLFMFSNSLISKIRKAFVPSALEATMCAKNLARLATRRTDEVSSFSPDLISFSWS